MKPETRVLNPRQGREWDALVDRLEQKDIFFTSAYARVCEEASAEKAKLFVYGTDDCYVIHPFMERQIRGLPFYKGEEELYDVVSPEYTGPAILGDGITNDFLKAFHEHCVACGYVTEFARLNPFLGNHSKLAAIDTLKTDREVVYIDLTQSKKMIEEGMEKRCRNAITRAQRVRLEVRRVGKGYVKDFAQLYTKTMEKANATKKYFYSLEFFRSIFNEMGDDVSLFAVEHEGRNIALSMFLHKYDTVHYYFSGAEKESLPLSPNNLLIHDVAMWAKEEGYSKLHLGGGHKPGDSLFKFKSSFSRNRLPFYTYRMIHKPAEYRLLCELKKVAGGYTEDSRADYFPKYRR